MQRTSRQRSAFTIVELLVVISILGILMAILLPAVGRAREQGRLTHSQANLSQLAQAHAAYAAASNGRQFTLTLDDIASYPDGHVGPTNAVLAVSGYHQAKSLYDASGAIVRDRWPPAPELGWGVAGSTPESVATGAKYFYTLAIQPQFCKNYTLLEPIVFQGSWGDPACDRVGMGYFRLPNARQFSQYVNGRFFDPVFFAPKDTVVMAMRDQADGPLEYLTPSQLEWSPPLPPETAGERFCFPSYSLSPAALFSPDVMRRTEDGGWQNPWALAAGFRAPAISQAQYPELKTHMIEHHWLQGARADCNPAMTEEYARPYIDGPPGSNPYPAGCQPYFFNHSLESTPAAMFYDGHVGLINVADAQRADGRAGVQSGGSGLWSRDTPFGTDGYFISRGYDDQSNASFHILTTGGIKGRDVLSGGG